MAYRFQSEILFPASVLKDLNLYSENNNFRDLEYSYSSKPKIYYEFFFIEIS